MTKAEMVKAARDMPVRMGDADKLRAQQRAVQGANPGALESWCPPNPVAKCHLCMGTLGTHIAGCPKAPRPARVQRLPPAAAPCGLVMDGDRIELHQMQCPACAAGKQATSYAGIDRAAPLDPVGLGRTCGHGFTLNKDCKRCLAALPDLLGACCPVAYNGRRGHSDWCKAKAAAAPKIDKMPSDDMINQIERGIDEAFKALGIPASLFGGSKACNGSCMKPLAEAPGSFAVCKPCGEKLKAEIAQAKADKAKAEPTVTEKAAALPHLSGCDCSKCKVGRAAACCNIGWHRTCAGEACPFHAPKVAPAPLMLLNEWDLLPDG